MNLSMNLPVTLKLYIVLYLNSIYTTIRLLRLSYEYGTVNRWAFKTIHLPIATNESNKMFGLMRDVNCRTDTLEVLVPAIRPSFYCSRALIIGQVPCS